MRHESLFFLFSAVTRIKGVGGGTVSALQRLLPAATALSGAALPLVRDLLFHLPVNLVDRRFTCALNAAPDNTVATFIVRVASHLPPAGRGGRKPYKVVCENETGTLTLVFFHASNDYIKQALPLGQLRVVSGRTEHFDFRLQMTHPDIITTVDKLEEVQKAEPVYPLTVGLTSRRIAKIIDTALAQLPALPEWIDAALITEKHWPSWNAALANAHHPQTVDDVSPATSVRERLAYDEILATQLHLARLRQNRRRQPGEVITGTGALTAPLLASLPFALTKGQQEVLTEIDADLQSGSRMGRLLQGDVGSGKTVVALFAMLRALEQGLQAALMVPTEIIAQQHVETILRLAEGLGIHTVLLTGSVKGKQREQVLADIASGKAALIIGTHALFQEQVAFANLALVVIDEQHRFGVGQRMALTRKGHAPHLLHMTATPIPRSLTMTLYGDMDCSTLKEKPAGRQPITTRVIPLSRYQEVMERLQAALEKGEKIYWICPLIEEAANQPGLATDHLPLATDDIAAAQTRFTEFTTRFGSITALAHGRMSASARDAEMHRFASGEARLLVATTVVEVGVDVRDATIIVIEQAERFGLSQLHQLRGRVGRGDKHSACVLLCSDRAGEVAVQRLSMLRDNDDGFAIAEADLAIRGGGDLLGTRQSGSARFVFTDPVLHMLLLERARDDARRQLEADPDFSGERGGALALLLQLFGHD